MKTPPQTKQTRRSGFTLLELSIAMSCAAIVGGAAFSAQSSALNLFRSNASVNSSHEGTRKVLDRLEREIQSAISIPALVGTNRDVIDSTGPAPGIAFLRQSGPLRRVAVAATAGSNVLTLDANGPAPVLGQRVLIPAYGIEGDIISANGNTVTLAAALPMDIAITSGSTSRNVVAVVTDVVSYVVIAGQLLEFQNAASNVSNLIVTGVTEPNPFGLPYNAVPNIVPTS